MNNHKYNIIYDIAVPDEAHAYDSGWDYLSAKMKEQGTEASLYASEFVFAKRLDYVVANNKTALYVEIFSKRVTDQWENVFATFLEADDNISVVTKRIIPVSQDALEIGVNANGEDTIYGFATRIELADRYGAELGHTQL